ncbi:hypothetical protein GE09DRAFT_1284308 [Coniochaeta sp. 2T2.1]|nr:hypothetical protein GE09DRAFT_1284308 [Coniochaeta sp. 2T2.1]
MASTDAQDLLRTGNDPEPSTEPFPKVYNDVYFAQSRASLSPLFETWTPFSRLPTELRLKIWLTVLRQHRMIEMTIIRNEDEEENDTFARSVESRYFTERNQLGNIISGRNYTLDIADRGHAASFHPLLWVNTESRHAALKLHYRVHLPFPTQDASKILYLNPEYDVINLSLYFLGPLRPKAPWPVTLLADFLHDFKAYDPKNEGVAHLALPTIYFFFFRQFVPSPNPGAHAFAISEVRETQTPTQPSIFQAMHTSSAPLTPSIIHPISAFSFAEILRRRLRSLMCTMPFRDNRRDMGYMGGEHGMFFKQTYPLCRRGNPTGVFRWLETDPRPGVQVELKETKPAAMIETIFYAWKKLEVAFGIHRRSADDRFRFYICPAINWPTKGAGSFEESDVEDDGDEDNSDFNPDDDGVKNGSNEEEEDGLSDKWRRELAQHFKQEEEDWLGRRQHINIGYKTHINRQGHTDAKLFELMEKTPCSAIGMWLFPVDVFTEAKCHLSSNTYDLSGGPLPGLFLFEV